MKCETYIILSRVYWIFRREYILPFLLEEYEARAVLSTQPAIFNIERKTAKEPELPVTCYY